MLFLKWHLKWHRTWYNMCEAHGLMSIDIMLPNDMGRPNDKENSRNENTPCHIYLMMWQGGFLCIERDRVYPLEDAWNEG